MDKFLYYNELFSIYKELLTLKEKEIFSLYYEENNSMGEISNLKQISRSAVGKRIKTVEKKLDFYESILKCREKQRKILDMIEKEQNQEKKKELEQLL